MEILKVSNPRRVGHEWGQSVTASEVVTPRDGATLQDEGHRESGLDVRTYRRATR